MAIKVSTKSEVFYKDGSLQYTLVGEIKFNPSLEQRLNNNLGVGSPFQKMWDEMLLKSMESYVPKLTGKLSESSTIHTVLGQGMLTWRTPYARRQYYEGRFPGAQQGGSLRGRLWGQRAANDKMADWERAAQEFIDGQKI